MAASISGEIAARGYPLHVTQAEFQDSQARLLWVIQYLDPASTPEATYANIELLTFEAPLEVLVGAVRENEEALRSLGIDVFIVAFRGTSNVYEISPDLMWSYAEDDVSWADVRDQMQISR